MRFLTHNHQGELKAPLHRLSVHLVGEACKAHVSLQILLLLLLKTDRKTPFWSEKLAGICSQWITHNCTLKQANRRWSCAICPVLAILTAVYLNPRNTWYWWRKMGSRMKTSTEMFCMSKVQHTTAFSDKEGEKKKAKIWDIYTGSKCLKLLWQVKRKKV